ncbi:MAG: MocA protein [Candidatus Poribacteria bacterium]|nr:MocA protein [Candidatus Poribacteria bacterium]
MMKTYRIGIVGCGGISSQRADDSPLFGSNPWSHAKAYAEIPECQVVAVSDIVKESTERFVNTWGDVWKGVNTYADHKEMLTQEKLDIVSVATPDNKHADILIDVANAGVKGIFCEKPLATKIQDADRMIKAIEENHVVINVDHTRRWNPIFHEARNLIRNGKIGNLHTIFATLGGPRAMMFRNGTHIVDMICFMAESMPAYVFAELEDGYSDYWEYKGDGGYDPKTEPAVSGYIHFENGVRAFYNCDKRIPAMSDWELTGSTGRIIVNDTRCELWTQSKENGLSKRLIHPPFYRYTGMECAIREIIRCIGTGEKTTSDARESIKTVEIMLGMLESQRRGNTKVKLPLERS